MKIQFTYINITLIELHKSKLINAATDFSVLLYNSLNCLWFVLEICIHYSIVFPLVLYKPLNQWISVTAPRLVKITFFTNKNSSKVIFSKLTLRRLFIITKNGNIFIFFLYQTDWIYLHNFLSTGNTHLYLFWIHL